MAHAPDPQDGASPAVDRSVVRAGDADRERVADLLRESTGHGRLDHDELEERLGATWAARTLGDLDVLVADLPPAEVPARRHGPEEIAVRAELRDHLVQRAGGAVGVASICVVVWAATGAGVFWPGFVILGLLAGVGAEAWRGFGPGGDASVALDRARRHDEEHDRRRRRERRVGLGDRRRDRFY